MGTMLLTIAVPASESDGPIEMYVSEDETIPRHQGGSQAGSDAVHLDLFGAAKEVLWMCPGINDMVKTALDRMEKAFAYNYVFFLKVALDLQTTYHSLSQQPPAGVFLGTGLVLRIARVLAERMVRKDKDGVSPSRELQLRTLVSALSLLYQLRIGQLDKEVYAGLLKGISERDSDTRARCANAIVGENRNSNGDSEFLVRHARDLIRRMSNDLPNFPRVNPQVTHYLFAAGYINQLECAMTSTALDNMWAGIIAPPSEWHRDMQHLYEGTAGAISLHHQVQYRNIGRASQYASNLAAEIAKSIVDKTEHVLQASDGGISGASDGAKEISSLEARLLVCGLLDLLCQLVTSFPHSDEIMQDAKALALKLIRTSNTKEFRNKAFEIMISSTAGCCEDEYYNIMRSLDLDIESFAQTGTPPTADKDLVLKSEELKREKREAMDRCEKRSILYKGALESMQRRYQGFRTGRSRRRTSQTIDQVLEMKRWDEQSRSVTAVSPAPSSLRSQVPTLSSQAPTCDTNNSPTSTPTYESGLSPTGTLLSPTDSTACQTLSSPTDSSCHTLLSRVRYDDSPIESPILPSLTPPNMTPSTPYPAPTTPHEAITPILDTTLRFSRLGQLFPDTMFEEPELYDDDFPSESNRRKMSVDFSIQSFDIDDGASTLPLQIPEEGEEDKGDEERKEETTDSERPQIMNHHPRISILSQTPIEPPLPSPMSTYPEPSLSRTPSSVTQAGSLKRQSRASKIFSRRPRSFIRDRRFHSVQLNKPLPEIDKKTGLAEDAPEPVVPGLPAQPVRSQSAFEMRNDKLDYFHLESPSVVSLLYANKNKPGLRPAQCDAEPVLTTASSSVDYDSQPIEHVFKVQPKDSCFSTVVSSDAKHAVFMSSQVFQVFSIPTPGESAPTKPKFTYRLGSKEEIRKAKVPWTYKAAAASEKYIVTITKEQVQVHDLEEECKVIFTERTTGWENTCVAIAADKLAIGMSKRRRDETQGALRIYKMNAPTYKGLPCDRVCDVLLPIDPRAVQDAPHLVSLTQDGDSVTCGTPKCGYFFSWDISRIRMGEPSLIAKGGLKITEGPGAEKLSATILFPDKKHIFCSTFPANPAGAEWGGSFTEPTTPPTTSSSFSSAPPSRCLIRQVSIRVTHSALAPLGNAAAFLTKSGTIWVTPVTLLEGENNLTTVFPINTKERLQNQQPPERAGRIAFTPEGDRIVGVDRKGKILTLIFDKKSDPLKIKTEVGGYF